MILLLDTHFFVVVLKGESRNCKHLFKNKPSLLLAALFAPGAAPNAGALGHNFFPRWDQGFETHPKVFQTFSSSFPHQRAERGAG